jgi:SAM-dependent methyltransferase
LFQDESDYFPYKTAMSRKGPSSIAKSVVNRLSKPLEIQSILDYGCGRGADVAYYKENGYVVGGYDNHSPFGFSNKPIGKFDLITINYVLNVLANPYERYLVLKEASQYLKENGYMLVTARSVFEIEKEAQTKNWPIYSDGYWSSTSKRTFQKGIPESEMIHYAKKLDLSVHPLTKTLKYAKNTSHVLLKSEQT